MKRIIALYICMLLVTTTALCGILRAWIRLRGIKQIFHYTASDIN